jgi:hypothetical protein
MRDHVTQPIALPGTPAGMGQHAKVLMRAVVTEGGSVLVDCPYCVIYYRKKNPVDVTKFVDADGKREVVAACSKGHVLRFKTIDEWREKRMLAGIQRRP